MTQATQTSVPEFTTEAARSSFARHLRAANKSPRTIDSYLEAVELLDRFLTDTGMPRDVRHIRREHVESFLVALQDRGLSPATVANRFRSLRVFFNWLVREDEIDASPMSKMPHPAVPDQPVPVLTDVQVSALLATTKGTTFEERRDRALLYVLIDAGLRRAECAGLRLEDVDLDRDRLYIEEGKGRRGRWVALRDDAANAVDRYLRLRPAHRHHRESALWIGKRGPLGPGGIIQLVRRRAKEAGIGQVYPHMLRHLAVHNSLTDGLQEADAMVLFGWRDPSMLRRYAASTSAERAMANARKIRGADRYR